MTGISRAFLAVVLFAALAGPQTANAILMGAPTSDYGSVGGIARATGYYGSGTLIADRWILTAGHVADAFEATNAAYFAYGDSFLRISNAYVHPPGSDADPSAYDLGLFELETSISGALLPTLFNGDFAGTTSTGYSNQESVLVGYGMNDPIRRTGEGVRRAGNNSVSHVDDSYLGFTGREGATAFFGDSGGSTWADFGLGEVLIGVHAFALSNGDGYDSYDLRIDRFQSWIDGIVGAGIVRWGNGTAPVSVPEPAPLTLLAAGLMLVALARKCRSAGR